jgi:hypothetical protein
MEEQVEKEGQEDKVLARQNAIKNAVTPHIAEIKNLLDSLTTIMGKENFQDTDLEGVFDVMDSILEQSNEIEELLFSLRNTIR